ncbi:hypothetical protein MNBD_GAMMA04-1917 [hydrothermal vent metagenome]|uniref:Uncharacterized protein n=1 Tax=hydrothermal vent metagenome TaxID=652676 RepID=A0A3B0VXY9_9ZZZZ
MNHLNKTITAGACIFLVYPAIALSSKSESLESYLKNYQPEIYQLAQEKDIDLYAAEYSAPNNNNLIQTDSVQKEDGITLAHPHPDFPITARSACENPPENVPGGIFLENNFIATCVSADGTFGNGSYSLGMTFNPSGKGTVNTNDYLQPGTPHEYFSVTMKSLIFSNNNRYGPGITGSDNIPTKISRLDRYSAIQEGGVLVKSIITDREDVRRLKMIQKYTLDPNSKEIIVRVEMTNVGQVTLDGITYARGLDPDQDRPTGSYSTLNRKGYTYYGPHPAQPVRVEPNNIAWALGKDSKLSVALYSVDPIYHNTCISNTWTTDPNIILNQRCNDKPIYVKKHFLNYSDSTINIAFKIGALKPNETKVFSFKYLFNKEKKRFLSELPRPLPIPIGFVK